MIPGTAEWAAHFYGNPGVPGSAQGKAYEQTHIHRVTIAKREIPVHRDASRAFRHLSLLIQYHNPRYWAHISKGTYDDWGFAHRYIAGTTILSMHSFGLAVDLNAILNPRTTDPNELHSEIWKNMRQSIEAIEKTGFMRWGGRYRSPDPMHFEVMWTPDKIKDKFDVEGRWK